MINQKKMSRKIDYIVIHCTATPKNTTVESIKNHWKNFLKWKSVGYHFLIEANGTIHQLDLPTNGVKGYNSNSIHISYIGGKDFDDRTEAQKGSILTAINRSLQYCKESGIKPIIQGHRDFPNVAKSCPQFNAKEEYRWITI
jgi:N-acetylmuramoyl-L-alanine amidase